jgi:hypothetical protein
VLASDSGSEESIHHTVGLMYVVIDVKNVRLHDVSLLR